MERSPIADPCSSTARGTGGAAARRNAGGARHGSPRPVATVTVDIARPAGRRRGDMIRSRTATERSSPPWSGERCRSSTPFRWTRTPRPGRIRRTAAPAASTPTTSREGVHHRAGGRTARVGRRRLRATRRRGGRLDDPRAVPGPALAAFADLVAHALANVEAREQLAASPKRLVEAAQLERRRLERNLPAVPRGALPDAPARGAPARARPRRHA
jgi:hypothetical protein